MPTSFSAENGGRVSLRNVGTYSQVRTVFTTQKTTRNIANILKAWSDANILFLISCFSADGNYEVRYKSNVLIYPNGEVLWVPPAIYQVNTIAVISNISL